jgi:oligosaccharide reducing-end xylanase
MERFSNPFRFDFPRKYGIIIPIAFWLLWAAKGKAAMKKINEILILTAFLIAVNTGYSQTIAPPYQVGNWPEFRTAAVSYTFDDGCSNQFDIAVPMFNEFGYKLTLFTITGMSPNWTGLQSAASQGHEVASHTVTHRDLNTLSIADQTTELANSQSAINSHVTGQQCVTLAYPYCSPSNQPLTAQYYISARHCQGFIEANTPGNYYQVSSLICGPQGSVLTAADFNSKFASVASTKGWCVFLIHGIDSDGGYSPLPSTVLRSSLQYLDARRSTFWVQTFGNVVRYVQERNAVTVAESSNTGDSITLQVTDALDNTIYNYPLTMRRPLPTGWLSVKVSQNGLPVNASIVKINSVKYVMFDVVPNGGDVVLSKTLYGDFTDGNTVDTDDLAFFCDYWLVSDCNQTAAVDLDGDCMVDFYEFAFLAGNWLQTL